MSVTVGQQIRQPILVYIERESRLSTRNIRNKDK
jgi:hypothetical protein